MLLWKRFAQTYGRNGFDSAAREKYVMGQHFQFNILHPHIFRKN